MRISIIGAGNVGEALGQAWARHGHEIVYGTRHPEDARMKATLSATGPKARTATVAQAAAAGEVVVLATPWPAAQEAIRSAGDLSDKVLIDCTNPLKPDLSGLTVGHTTSAAEQVAAWAKGAKVSKACNHVGANVMSNTQFGGGRPVMFVCGDDAASKPTVLRLVSEIGFEAVDAGNLSVARLLEPLAMLWIHLAFAQDLGREFAFGLLKR